MVAEAAVPAPVIVDGDEYFADCDDAGHIRMWAMKRGEVIAIAEPTDVAATEFFRTLARALARQATIRGYRAA